MIDIYIPGILVWVNFLQMSRNGRMGGGGRGAGGALYNEITCTQLNELNFNPIISKGSCALIRQKAFSSH